MTDLQTIPRTSDEDGLVLRAEQGLELLRMATELDQVRSIKVQAFAYRAAMRELGASKKARHHAERLIVRAERRIGEFTGAMEGTGKPGRPAKESSEPPKVSALAEHGIRPDEAHEYEQLARIPEPELVEHEEALVAEGKPITRGRILARHNGPKKTASKSLQKALAILRELDEHELGIVANAIAKKLGNAPRLEVVR